MNAKIRNSNVRRIVIVAGICVAIAMVLLARPALADLPPRPEPATEPTEEVSSGGSQLVLLVQFPQDWPWDSVHWQDLHTMVQWQDPNTSAWHDVEGWQGTLDSVEIDDAGLVTGTKTWWVGGGEMGKGPFRWLVYDGPDGSLLATSAPFNLPATAGNPVVVIVTP